MNENIEDADIVVDLSGGKLFVSGLRKRIADLRAELTKHRWIPVSEKSKKKSFITAIDMESFAVTSFFFNGTKKVWDALVLKNYTHWKPIILPKDETDG